MLFRFEMDYSFILQYYDVRWIKRFMYLGVVVVVFWLGAIVANSLSANALQPYTYYPLRLSSSLLLYWIGYQGFFRYRVVKDRISLRNYLENEGALEEYVQISAKLSPNSGRKGNERVALFKKIDGYVNTQKRYLDSSLSLEVLAQELQMSVSNLSLQINTHSGYNFSDYINHYRVEKAKMLLLEKSFANYTNVAIGLECGFNSRSTFYAAFKKFTDLTPSSFRDQQSRKLQKHPNTYKLDNLGHPVR